MRNFSIRIFSSLNVHYNHYLSYELIKEEWLYDHFEMWYPLGYCSRKFDKPARKYKDGACIWYLDGKPHRVGRPAIIYSNGRVRYWEDGKEVK